MIKIIISLFAFMVGLFIAGCLIIYVFRVLMGLLDPYTIIPKFSLEEIFRPLDF